MNGEVDLFGDAVMEAQEATEATALAIQQEQPAATVEAPQTAVAPAMDVLGIIAQAATDPRVDVTKMKELFELRREVMKEQAASEARQAYRRACRNMPVITKRGVIDFGKGQKPIPYARWEDIATAIRPIYEVEGFTLSFDTRERNGGGLIVTAKLEHDNGHLITSEFPVPLDTSGGKQNIQGMGSSGSYGQRYATKGLFNLVFEGEDDDGKDGNITYITKEQVDEIAKLVGDTETDPRAFLEWVFVDNEPHTYAEITKDKFVGVVNALKGKLRRMKMEGTGA